MNESFKKLKKKTVLASVIKSVIIGLSAGLFVAGVLLLAFQLSSIQIHWAYYIVAGVSAALIAAANCLLFTLPDDKKVAKKYDAEYGLNEKLQTMVAFEGVEGDMISIQKQDALERLGNAPALKIKFSRIWYYVLIAVLAMAMFFSAVFIPAAAQSVTPPPDDETEEPPVIETPGEEEEKFVFGLAMESSLDDLVNEVRESFLNQEMKDAVIEMLQNMRASLKEVSLKSEAVQIAFATVTSIDLLIVDANSFRKISSGITSFDANLSTAIVNGFVAYKGRLTESLNINYVNSLKTDLGEYIDRAMEELLKESSSALKVNRLVYNEDDKGLAKVLEEYSLNLDGALDECGIDESDELYQSLLTLSNGLKSLKASVDRGGATNSYYWGIIDQHYEKMNKSATSALCQQGYNCIMENYIRQQLAKTLGISFNGLTALYADLIYEGDDGTGGNGSGDDGTGGNGGGGAGSGDIIYGSDDLIYYPVGIEDAETGEIKYYVPFGQVLAEYETAINNGALAEDFPEYLKDFLEQYINYLHNGTGDSE